jgi:hypothetical protein
MCSYNNIYASFSNPAIFIGSDTLLFKWCALNLVLIYVDMVVIKNLI